MRTALLIPLAILFAPVPDPAAADWLPAGTPVCVAPGFQGELLAVPLPFSFETNNGQDLVAIWSDSRDTLPAGSDLFFEDITFTGPALPPSNGTPAVVAPGFQGHPDASATGSPIVNSPSANLGVIVAWSDNRNGALDVYAKRLLDRPSNTPWPADGVPVCTAPGAQSAVRVVGHPDGGATIAWIDPRDGFNAVFAQRLDLDGVPLWAANGVPVCELPVVLGQLRLVSTGDGGAYLVWISDRGSGPQAFASRLLPDGTIAPGWPANGLLVSSLAAAGLGPALLDGTGGLFVTFFSGAGLPMAARLDGNAVIHAGWPADGVALAQTSFQGGIDDAIAFGDGLVAVWEKNILPPGDTVEFDLFAQRLRGDGTRPSGWGPEGNVVCDAPGNQTRARLAAGPLIFAVWEDERPGATGRDVYAMSLLDNGSPSFGWPANGVAVATGNGNQFAPGPVWDGVGGVMVAYLDDHDFNSLETDVFAQRVNLNGTIANTAVPLSRPRALRLAAPIPNPSRSEVALAMSAPPGERVSAQVLDAVGRLVRTLAAGGANTLRWDLADDAGRPVDPGIYYVRVSAAGQAATRAVVVRR